jgi:transposase-like protein
MLRTNGVEVRAMAAKRVWRSQGFWEAAVVAQCESGLSVVAFCERRSLSVQTFYNWRRRLQGTATAAAVQPTFVPVCVVDVQSDAPCPEPLEVVVGLRRIVVRNGFDVTTLQQVVAALETLPC